MQVATFSLMLLWKSLESLDKLVDKTWGSVKHRSYSSKASYGELRCIGVCWIFKITARRGTSKQCQCERCSLVLVVGTVDVGIGRN